MEQQDTKNKKKNLIITATVILFVLLVIVLTIFFLQHDKKRIVRSFVLLNEDVKSFEDEVVSINTLAKIVDEVAYGDAKIDYSIIANEIPDFPASIKVEGITNRSFNKKKFSSTNHIEVMNKKIGVVDLYADHNDLYIYVPKMLNKAFLVDTTSLPEAFNESVISKVTKLTLPERDYRLFKNEKKKEVTDLSDFYKMHKSEITAFYRDMKVSHKKELENLEIQDGEAYTCNVYEVSVSQESTQNLWQAVTYTNGKDYKITNDLCLDILIDGDGVVRRIRTTEPIIMSKKTLDIDLVFKGKDRVVDAIQICATVDSDEGKKDYSISNRYEDGYFYTSVNCDAEVDTECMAEYEISVDEEDESAYLKIYQLDYSVSEQTPMHLTGNIQIITEDVEVKGAPEDYVDILNMGVFDVVDMTTEIVKKVLPIISFFRFI